MKYLVTCYCAPKCPTHEFDDRAEAVAQVLNREEYPQKVQKIETGEVIYKTAAMEESEERMSQKELLEKLKALNTGDIEADHIKADRALLKYINCQEITKAFEGIEKWYL